MDILVIGNGFDLAHELPTKYTDFLFFCSIVLEIIKENHIEIPDNKVDYIKWIEDSDETILLNADDTFKFFFNKGASDITEREKEVYIWIEYFLQCDIYGTENWIDFESEISKVIQSLDDDMHGLSQVYNIEDIVYDLSNIFLKKKYSDYIGAVQPINPIINGFLGITFREIRDKLSDDLNGLIRTFEIYLTEYVEKIDCKLVSPDIQGIMSKENMKYRSGYELYVLSFNYTNTYQRIYIDKAHEQAYTKKYIDYIHGKAHINNTIESNNMVLGIDEYLSKKQKNKEIEFIAFKKFYQRIHKQTGCEYREWINKIIQKNKAYKEKLRLNQLDFERNRGMGNEGYQTKMNLKNLEENPPKYNLYFFGHSLDITDKDILRDLILIKNVHTTIFYYNKDVMGQQIANLVKVIGQDELIKRTNEKTIEFKQQQDMVSI